MWIDEGNGRANKDGMNVWGRGIRRQTRWEGGGGDGRWNVFQLCLLCIIYLIN